MKSRILEQNSLDNLDRSFYVLYEALCDRSQALRGILVCYAFCSPARSQFVVIHSLKNPDYKEQFRRFHYGMVCFIPKVLPSAFESDSLCIKYYSMTILDRFAMSPYWESDPDIVLSDFGTGDLDLGIQANNSTVECASIVPKVDIDQAYQQPVLTLDEELFDTDMASLAGRWCGVYVYDDGRESDGHVSFTISFEDDTHSFTGQGVGAYGHFNIQGLLDDDRSGLTFIHTYAVTGVLLSHTASIGAHGEEISGGWSWDLLERSCGGSANPSFVLQGSFVFQRRPEIYLLCRPDAEKLKNHKIRALWELAINAALYIGRSRSTCWETNLKERRDRKHTYIALFIQKTSNGGRLAPAQASQYAQIISKTCAEDLYIWRLIALSWMNCEDPTPDAPMLTHALCVNSSIFSSSFMPLSDSAVSIATTANRGCRMKLGCSV